MSQFRPRFQQPPSRLHARDAEVKLRTQGGAYAPHHTESPYSQHQVESQKIKSLSFWSNSDSEENEENEWTDRQSPTPFILAIIILVVASTLLWFLFRWASGDNSSTPPIIAADTAPFKVRPENPGGMMIPHQDKLIYGRLSQDTQQPIERLLPPPEQPMAAAPPPPMNAPQMNAPQMGGAPVQQHPYPQQQGYAQPEQSYTQHQQGYVPNSGMQQGQQPQPDPQRPQPYPPFQSQPPYPQQQPYPGQGQQSYAQPGQIPQPQQYHGQPPYPTPHQTQPHYGPGGPAPTVAQPTEPQVPLAAASNPVPPKQLSAVEGIKPASDETEDESEERITSEGISDLEKLIAKEAETPLKRPATKKEKNPIKPMALDPGKHKVQIASLPSRSMAEQEMKRLRGHHSAVFQNKPWQIQRINLGSDRGYTHRLVVGSFADHASASKFCKKLRSAKISCQVVGPANQ
jgi:hypothetical protein